MRITYFGTYDRRPEADEPTPDVGRNSILIGGLRAAGIDVAECHVRLWPGTTAKIDAVRRPSQWPRIGWRLGMAWMRLRRDFGRLEAPDVMIVGATAPLDLLLARWLLRASPVPIVFDPLISLAETARDRGLWPATGPIARAARAAEGFLWQRADLVLVDTPSHGRAFEAELGLAPSRRLVVPVGAPDVFRVMPPPAREEPSPPFRLLYFGQYIPLHGLEYVIDAMARLRGRAGAVLRLVGTGQTLDEMRARARSAGLDNITFRAEWLSPERLRDEELAKADLCLGVFGHQPKASVVVPYKVYASMAAARPVLTADTPSVRELLQPGTEVLTCAPANGAALADAIAGILDQPSRLAAVAASGRAAYDDRFTPPTLGRLLAERLETLVSAATARPAWSTRSRQGIEAWR